MNKPGAILRVVPDEADARCEAAASPSTLHEDPAAGSS
ncbi:MAG: hypothetical protein V7608_3967, partial [Hyphomicrobiales bacterium]